MSLTFKKPSPQEEFKRIEKHYPQLASTGCTRSFCQSGRMVHTDEPKVGGDDHSIDTVETDAVDFLHQLRRDGIIKSDTALAERVLVALSEIRSDVAVAPYTNGSGTKKCTNGDKPMSEYTNGNGTTPCTNGDAADSICEFTNGEGIKPYTNGEGAKPYTNGHGTKSVCEYANGKDIKPICKYANGKGTRSISEFASGVWHQSTQELEHGVRLSWKHARKCIMRSEYSDLRLQDLRHITTSKEMGRALLEGMREAFNGGDIQPSVFAFSPKQRNQQGPMVWNQQLLAFAGYRQPDGSILGDPMNASLTSAIISLGWEPPALRTRWDVLPLVTMMDGDEPCITPITEEMFPLVPIGHPRPEHALAFKKLGLRWVPAPALSQLGFDIGGVQYTAAPFIGWFMDAEIGVRDLADTFRYNVLPSVVSALNLLPPGQELDELHQSEKLALLSHAQAELNYAVHWSFKEAGVRMSDSLTASAMYTSFDDDHLERFGFRLPADPYWLAPPEGSIVPIWHRGAAPNYQPKPMICRLKENPIKVWRKLKAEKDAAKMKLNGHVHCNGQTNGVNGTLATQTNGISSSINGHAISPPAIPWIRIFYCSSGTTAQRLATKLEQRIAKIMAYTNGHHSVAPVAPLNHLELDSLSDQDSVFIIASCNGRGNIPVNGLSILAKCKSFKQTQASGASFCIFGNGNSSYGENFNGCGIKIQTALCDAGFKSDLPLFHADTLKEDPPWRQFEAWSDLLRARYGDDTDQTDSGFEAGALADDDAFGQLLDQVSQVEVASIQKSSKSGIKHVALDMGGLEYSHMSHVDVFVPLSRDAVDDLLWTARFTGNEVLKLGEKQASTRQIFSLVDPKVPFRSLHWATKLGLGISDTSAAKILQMPMETSIRSLPVGWQAKLKRGDVSAFFQSLPIRKPRTFSCASSQDYWGTLGMSDVLELAVQTHIGGLFTDCFLSNATKRAQLHVRIRHGPGEHLIHDQKPLIAFTTGSGIAPLRGLLQARCNLAMKEPVDGYAPEQKGANGAALEASSAPGPISLFLGFSPHDSAIIKDSFQEAVTLSLIDMVHLMPSNPAKERVQDKMFENGTRDQIKAKIRDEKANVFVCASKEAADDFARNLEAVVGVASIREALGERWVEEVYACTQ